MATDLFSVAGMAHWRDQLNASTRFAEAAGDWVARVLLLEENGENAAARGTWVLVSDGKCMEARPSADGDEANSDFVLSAAPGTWSALIAARTTPVMAALSGRLKLLKGDAFALIPHARAAAELLAAAAGGNTG